MCDIVFRRIPASCAQEIVEFVRRDFVKVRIINKLYWHLIIKNLQILLVRANEPVIGNCRVSSGGSYYPATGSVGQLFRGDRHE